MSEKEFLDGLESKVRQLDELNAQVKTVIQSIKSDIVGYEFEKQKVFQH